MEQELKNSNSNYEEADKYKRKSIEIPIKHAPYNNISA
jgi:hypothetical protein